MTTPPSPVASPPPLLREWSYNGPQHEEPSPPVAPAVVVEEEESRQSKSSSSQTPPQYYPVATFVSSFLRNSIDHIYTGVAETVEETQHEAQPLPMSTRSEDVNAVRRLEFTTQNEVSARSAQTEGAIPTSYADDFDDHDLVIIDGDLVAIPAPPPNEEEMEEIEFQSRPRGVRKNWKGLRKWIKKRTAGRKQQDEVNNDSQRKNKRKARRRRRDSDPDVSVAPSVPPMAPITEVSASTSSAVSADFIGNADQVLYPQAGVLGVASADAYIESDDKADDVAATVEAEKMDVPTMLFLAREESELEQSTNTYMDPVAVKSMMNDLETASKPQAKARGCPLSASTSSDEDVYNDTLKIVMIGDSVEKSMLARALRNSYKRPKQRNTLGVDVHNWVHSDVNFSMWDIQGASRSDGNANAGAHPSTQSLFFTPNALYVLVWDLAANNDKAMRRNMVVDDEEDDEEEDNNEFLLEEANRQADRALEADIFERVLPWVDRVPKGNAFILPVVTIPEGMDEFEVQRRCSVLQAMLMNHMQSTEGPKLIFGSESILRVDFEHGVEELQATIVAIATDQTERVFDHVGAPVRPETVEVFEIVRRMRQEHKVILLDHLLAEMSIICSVEDVMASLHYLASIGELLYFGTENKDDMLSRYVILSRKWLVSALSCILRNDLKRELSETRRFMNMQCAFSGQAYPENEILKTLLSGTNSSCPILSSSDSSMLWQSMSFMREAADRTSQLSEATTSSTMFEFLERLLVHKGVFLPLDVSHQDDHTPTYFVPSLLAQGEPNDVWTYKSSDSWMTTLCHSWLLRDGSPANLMEHVSVSLIQDLYEFSQSVTPPNPRRLSHTQSFPLGHSSMADFLNTHESVGRIKIHHIMCWKSSVLVKIGCVFAEPDSGEIRESFAEIFVSLVDPQSKHSVASSSIGSGMTRLVICGKGQAGHQGRKLWKGGYAVALDSIKASLANLSNVDRQVVCPDCLAHSHPTVASTWGWDDVRAVAQSGDSAVRCMRGHLVDTDLLCGTCKTTTQPPAKMPAAEPLSRVSKSVSSLLDGVVVVALWDERTQHIHNVGSGFIVDKKLGLIVTAGHILFDMSNGKQFGTPYFGLKRAKAVIGVISDGTHTAKFRYFAEIVAHDINNVDACVLRITSKMEQDVDGVNCSDHAEIPLVNDIEAIKAEKLQPLRMTRNFELEESVRIIGFNQGGENILEQGKHVNRVVDFAKGYICKNFRAPWADDDSSSESSSSMSLSPRQEIVVMMPTICGHSGGPCVNDDGKVVGILSRADSVDRQRCYVVPSSELKILVSRAKETCRAGSAMGRLVHTRGHTT